MYLESMDTDDFGQAQQLEETFMVPDSNAGQLATEILLSVIGTIGTVIGVLMPLGAIGGVTEATITKGDAETVVTHGSGGAGQALGLPRGDGQPVVQADPPVNGDSTDAQPPPGDDAITPSPNDGGGGAGDGGTGGDGDATVTITTGHGTGIGGKVGNTQFLGNAAFIAPASLVNLGNTVWADVRPAE